jgi:hypothetical protein
MIIVRRIVLAIIVTTTTSCSRLPHDLVDQTTRLFLPKILRVNWIDAIAISAKLRNAIATLNFGKMPLQISVPLRYAITPP